jgi:hypothetical protein
MQLKSEKLLDDIENFEFQFDVRSKDINVALTTSF